MKKFLGIALAVAVFYSINFNTAQADRRGGGGGFIGNVIGGGGNHQHQNHHGQNFQNHHGQNFRIQRFIGGYGGGLGLGYGYSQGYSLGIGGYGGGLGLGGYGGGLGLGGCGISQGYCAPQPIIQSYGSYGSAGGYAQGYYAPPQQGYYAPPPQQYAEPAPAPAPPPQYQTDYRDLDARYVSKDEFKDFADDVYYKLERLRDNLDDRRVPARTSSPQVDNTDY